MEHDLIKEERQDNDLSIDFSSVFELEKVYRDHSVMEAKYVRAFAEANEQVDTLTLQLLTLESKIVDEQLQKYREEEGKPFPVSGIRELRKRVVLDQRYQILSKRLIEATKLLNLFKGLTYTWTHRSDRLKDIATIANRSMNEGPKVTVDRQNARISKASEALEKNG